MIYLFCVFYFSKIIVDITGFSYISIRFGVDINKTNLPLNECVREELVGPEETNKHFFGDIRYKSI